MKKTFSIIIWILFFYALPILAQQQDRPKLVVGIVVDQMRQEYLYRFKDKFGKGGFNRLQAEGFSLRNMHYNYIPTFTGPGHASVYTGTTPAYHGIIANDWYDRETKGMVYCTSDTRYQTIGSSTTGAGAQSPSRMLSTTITDELQLSTGGTSQVVGISLKDRGSILPAGHLADMAYWYDFNTGRMISSTYYASALPDWAEKFNERKLMDKYLEKGWQLSMDKKAYSESGPDGAPHETPIAKFAPTQFPYDLLEIASKAANPVIPSQSADVLKYRIGAQSPWGDRLLTEFAMEAVSKMNLGKGAATDFLCLSYSSPDMIGHAFGPSSVEMEDEYIKLDLCLAELILFLDQKLGKENYLLFLTADHGVVEIPNKMIDAKIPAGYADMLAADSILNTRLSRQYGSAQWVLSLNNDQVFLNRDEIAAKKLDLEEVQEYAARLMLEMPGVCRSYSAIRLPAYTGDDWIIKRLQKGFHQKRSGDVLFVLEPGWLEKINYGTSHGTGYTYDTHVPSLWYGWSIKPGESLQYYEIPDIATTLALKLHTTLPNSCTGKWIEEVAK